VYTPPASGYEISIYGSLPWSFWLLIVVSILSLFCALLAGKPVTAQDCRVLLPSAVSSLVSVVVLLLIPYFRGYTLYQAGDTLTHLGFVRDIFLYGQITGLDVYPGIHVFEATLTYATSISPIHWTFFWPPLFFLEMLLGVFLLARYLGSFQTGLFACALLIIPVLGAEATRESIDPSFDAFCLMPAALYLMFKSRGSVSYSVAFVLVLGVLTVFHVEVSLFLWFFFIATLLVSRYVSRRPERVSAPPTALGTSRSARRGYLTAICLVGVLSIAFFSSLAAFGSTVTTIYSSLISSTFVGPITQLTPRVTTGFFPLAFLAIALYGGVLVYVGLATVMALLVVAKIAAKRRGVTAVELLESSMMLECLGLDFVFLLYVLIIGYNFTRMLKYPFLISALILGAYFTASAKSAPAQVVSDKVDGPKRFDAKRSSVRECKTRLRLRPAIAALVIAVAVICVLNTYPNVSTHGYNFQNSSSVFSAMSFFLTHRNESYPVGEVLPLNYQTRFAQAFYGIKAGLTGLRNGYEMNVLPPPHFGYGSGQFLGAAYSTDTYLLVPALSRTYYPDVYPGLQQVWRYTPSDFGALNHDPTVNQIYDNGGMQILEVLGS